MLKKKKWFALVLIGMLAFSFSGCQKTEQEKPSQSTEENAEPKEEPKEEEETEIVIENKLLSKGDLKKIEADGEFLIMTPQQFAENYNFMANMAEDTKEIKNFQIQKANGIKIYSYSFENGMKLNLMKEEEAEKNQFSKIEFQKSIPLESFSEDTGDYMLQIYQGFLACAIESNSTVSKNLAYLIVTAKDEDMIGKHNRVNSKSSGFLFEIIYENEIMTFSISPFEKPIEITDRFEITIEEFQKRYNSRAEALDEEKIEDSSIEKETSSSGTEFIYIPLQDGFDLLLELSEDNQGIKGIGCTVKADLEDSDSMDKLFVKSVLIRNIFNPDSEADISGAYTDCIFDENHTGLVSDDKIKYFYKYNTDNNTATFMIMPKQ